MLIIASCNHKKSSTDNKSVHISYQNNRYTLIRNGTPFRVKGAAGYAQPAALSAAGGNTIRTWDTTHLDQILQQAVHYNFAVVVGLTMPDNRVMDNFYNQPEKVKAQYNAYAQLINKYKNHPAILCWCLGNELPFPFKPSYNNFYTAFNHLVNMIHRQDPSHPVTTTMVNFQPKYVFNIKYRTQVDFISFNIFGAIKTLKKDLADYRWLWSGPFLITEWGIDGPWNNHEQTAWGAYIESTSTKKAEQYHAIYQNYMPVDHPGFLGSLVFYWGHKQENTPTWFSLFDELGARTEAVYTMQQIWTHRPAAQHAPAISYMLVNGKGAKDNIFLAPDTLAQAELKMPASKTTHLRYKWQILPEDWYQQNNTYRQQKLTPMTSLFTNTGSAQVTFKTPDKEGPYRIYVYAYDRDGNFATCNTPFYVLSKP